MHDPMTVAFEIRSPIRRKHKLFKDGYREPFITIWHRDPERGGDDDSCGWAYVNLSKADCEWAAARAKEEWRFWFSSEYDMINFARVDQLAILGAVWKEARFQAGGCERWRPLTAWDMGQVFALMDCSGDNFGTAVRRARESAEGLEELLSLTLRVYRTRRRPWWRRPRWHVHHWRLQVHPIQDFKRWAWSRCAGCGKRFRWGYAPVTGQWDSDGPRWFRGETGKYHHECYPRPVTAAQTEASRE